MNHAVYLQQTGLKALGFDPGPIDGDPGPRTQAAFTAWQSSLNKPSAFSDALATTALAEVGTKEEGDNGGERVREYQHATWLVPGAWPWCAAFVCWCFATAVKLANVKASLPKTAGAFDFENWARENAGQGVQLIKPATEPVREGDIVVFTFSHIGIAVANESGGYVKTVEGNTNDDGEREGDGVYRKTRKKSQIRSIIRVS